MQKQKRQTQLGYLYNTGTANIKSCQLSTTHIIIQISNVIYGMVRTD